MDGGADAEVGEVGMTGEMIAEGEAGRTSLVTVVVVVVLVPPLAVVVVVVVFL